MARKITRPAWAGFKTGEEGRTKIMLIYTWNLQFKSFTIENISSIKHAIQLYKLYNKSYIIVVIL
jgi:hypothetical protein